MKVKVIRKRFHKEANKLLEKYANTNLENEFYEEYKNLLADYFQKYNLTKEEILKI